MNAALSKLQLSIPAATSETRGNPHICQISPLPDRDTEFTRQSGSKGTVGICPTKDNGGPVAGQARAACRSAATKRTFTLKK